MRVVNKLSGIAEQFVESNLAAAIGAMLTLIAVRSSGPSNEPPQPTFAILPAVSVR